MKENIKMRKVFRIFLAFVSTFFIIVMIWIIIDCFTTKRSSTKKVITYNIKDDIGYNVILKENNYFSNDDENIKYYPIELMDKVEVSFNYDLLGSDHFSANYDYEIITSLKSKIDNNIIWEKDETTLNRKNSFDDKVRSVKLFDSVTIDVNPYRELAQNFYELTGNDVYLTVSVNINNKLNVSGYDDNIIDKQVLSISFPITGKIAKIDKSIGDDINKKVLSQYQVDDNFNTYLFTLSMLILVSLLPIMIMSYVSLFNLINLDDYSRKLKVIKKKYKYLIKQVKEEPIFKDKEVVSANSYRDVASICNDKDLPMNIYERTSGRECWIYVEDEKEVLLYILTPDYHEIDMRDNSKVIKIINKKNKAK